MEATALQTPAAPLTLRSVHEMPFGASLRAGGGVSFGLWAPTARSAQLLIGASGQEHVHEAAAQGDGWYRFESPNAVEGTPYRWQIDGELSVPDPASRFNPTGPHGSSVVVDPRRFEWDAGWQGRPWGEAVIYEMHVGCFTTEGTYEAAESRLPELVKLGISAVQLMPLADAPGDRGWGYDGVLPFAPFHAYGSPDQLKHFVQAAHRLGLMVFMDVVYNHFGPDGNYLSRYAAPFFSKQHSTAWGDAINYDGEGAANVREFFIQNALYWIGEYHADGLRFDAVHAIVDTSPLHIMDAISQRVHQSFPDRQVHLILENDRNDARMLSLDNPDRFDGQWNDDFHHAAHVLLTGEHDGYYADYADPLQHLARTLTHGFALDPMQEGDAPASAGGPMRCASQGTVPLAATVNFLQNHDHVGNRALGERLSVLAGPEALKLATAVQILGPAMPMVFMGEEFGATTPFLYFCDWQGDLRRAVREGREKQFSQFSGYTQGSLIEPVPDPSDLATFRRSKLDWAQAAEAAHQEQWQFHAMLIELRKRLLWPQLAKLRTGEHTAWRVGDHGLRVRWRFGQRPDEKLVLEMAVNFSDQTLTLDTPSDMLSLREPSPLYLLGHASATELGPWAGHWSFGREES